MSHAFKELYLGHAVQALNAADMAQKVYLCDTPSPVLFWYYELIRAVALYTLGQREAAKVSLMCVVEETTPDQLWMIWAQFHFQLGDLMDEAIAHLPDEGKAAVLKLCAMRAGPPRVSALVRDMRNKARLSPRQRQIALMALDRMSNPQIAQALKITEHTVKTHMQSIMSKLGISRRGMITPELLNKTEIRWPEKACFPQSHTI